MSVSTFRYRALDYDGRPKQGWIAAPSLEAARDRLRGRRLRVLDIQEDAEQKGWLQRVAVWVPGSRHGAQPGA